MACLAPILAAGGLAAPGARAGLSPVPKRTFVTNGPVRSIVRSGGTVYLGGDFSQVGPRTGPSSGVSRRTGQPDLGWPEVSGGRGVVKVAKPDGRGGWYIGGNFARVGAVARRNLAHIGADKRVDRRFRPDIDAGVEALAVSASTLYVGGAFTSVDGRHRNHIAAVRRTDGRPTSWNPDANNKDLPARVLTLAVSEATVYAGGRFSSIGGRSRDDLAALRSSDGHATR